VTETPRHTPPATAGGVPRWIIAGTPVDQPYPCACGKGKYARCSPMWCSCAGRTDPPSSRCCGTRYSAEDAARAAAEYRERKDRERAGHVET